MKWDTVFAFVTGLCCTIQSMSIRTDLIPLTEIGVAVVYCYRMISVVILAGGLLVATLEIYRHFTDPYPEVSAKCSLEDTASTLLKDEDETCDPYGYFSTRGWNE